LAAITAAMLQPFSVAGAPIYAAVLNG